jgi:demethylmenaquinone methyltransferase/2-methoxy-6-polyprenyl-1,4-benzoquinol methylase
VGEARGHHEGSTRTARVYDWWSDHQRLFRALRALAFAGRYGRLHRLAIDRLFAHAGQRVLDLGCGPGVNFPALAGAVGPGGRVVGVDASGGMVRRARTEAASVDGACSVVRADAGTLPVPDAAFDRAFSTLAVSAIPDGRAAVGEVARALRPGGRFVVLDAQPFQTFPLTVCNPFVNPVSSWATDWHPHRDVPALLAERFDTVHVETFGGGTAFVATAELAA